MSCCAGSMPLQFAEEKGKQSAFLQLEDMKHRAKKLADGSFFLRLSVPDVHCVACISAIERALAKAPGVLTARVNLTLRQLAVTVSHLDDLPKIVKALDDLGYRHYPADERQDDQPELKILLRALAVSGFAAANVMLLSVSVWNGAEQSTRDLFHFVSALIALPAVAYAGQPFFKSAFQSLRHRRMNMDVPISLGVQLATGMSVYESVVGGGHAYFDAAVTLLFFLLIGRVLDVKMRGRARELVTGMARLTARGGMQVLENGTLHYVPQESIAPGMMLRVTAGARLPADSVIISGTSLVDRSLVTGESEPQMVMQGTQLEAGVLNLSAPIDVRALRNAEQSFVGEVKQMLAAAEEGRGHYVRLADRMARVYSPAVHVLALLTFVGWMIATSGNVHQSLTVAVAVLIITCPCALGLAVPVAHVVAASSLFKRSVLVKDGGALERLAEIDHAAFDKTGTLTDNKMNISHCDIPKGTHASVARALALGSQHPAAQALARYLPGSTPIALNDVVEVPGFGVEAEFDAQLYRLGRTSWVAEITSDKANGSGLAFGTAGGKLKPVAIEEEVRFGAVQTLSVLHRRGIEAEILSGDREEAVSAVARRLNVTHTSHAMTPAAKLERLKNLADAGRKVLMVGDGLNDAPALAAAHVSIAPSSATDIGRTAADFVFLGKSLEAVANAHEMALRARRIVQQNFALAAAYNAFAVPLAIAGYLDPLLAAIAMSTSSLIVIGNSLRLNDHIWAKKRASTLAEPTLEGVPT